MKISHLGIKLSIFLLTIIILVSYMIYWKSISTLSNHMTSIIQVSDHLEAGEGFHSAVHSMMMDVKDKDNWETYVKDREEADKKLSLLNSYLDQVTDVKTKSILSESTSHMSEAYTVFKNYTKKVILRRNMGYNMRAEHNIQKIFNEIFKEYKKLHIHHSKQKTNILSKTQSIRKSIFFMLVIQFIVALAACFLVIAYFDRVVFKLFDHTEKLALHDKLTGLYNRHGLDRIISKLNTPGGTNRKNGHGIILLDIDHFKTFNDIYGHQAGDQVLVNLAKVLFQTVRTEDHIVRYGGEEFLILLSGTDVYGTKKVAEKICKTVAATPFDLLDGNEPQKVTVSIGFAATSNDHGNFQKLIKISDERLYRAKNNGRDKAIGPDILEPV